MLDPDDFPIVDPENEERQGSTISAAVGRAKENKGKLLRGYTIYCTEHIHGGFETFKKIVEVNGGRCVLYRARAGASAVLRSGQDDESDASESGPAGNVYLVSGTSAEEAKLWPRFQQMVEETGKTPVIAHTDWILFVALTQDNTRWRAEYDLPNRAIEL